MSTVYASSEDYTALFGTPAPPKIDALLRSASILVRRDTMTATYATDTNGKPTEPRLVDAFKEATCSQAQFWSVNEIDPSGGGLPQTSAIQSKKIGTASLVYDTTAQGNPTVVAARIDAASTLCPEAWLVLQQAGLVPGMIQHG